MKWWPTRSSYVSLLVGVLFGFALSKIGDIALNSKPIEDSWQGKHQIQFLMMKQHAFSLTFSDVFMTHVMKALPQSSYRNSTERGQPRYEYETKEIKSVFLT